MEGHAVHDRRRDDRALAPGVSWSMVLDRTTDAVMLSDGAGVIVYVNEPLLRLFGYSPNELVGQSVEFLLRECDDMDVEGLHADGSLFPIDLQQTPLPETTFVVATVRDMTLLRHSSVDVAIGKIDLGLANAQIDELQASLDLVIQQLFALGTSLMASAANETVLAERLENAVRGIDEVIDAVQQRRRASRH
jgi:PAS domain-containing protein